ncbi:hypothetical protein DND132_2055 [Pseudodesulfovibrio mercurii]|uniref:Uncharacterized protein n=1 Tax=Pseudodesulfovibrio mercurii TaxID=641491 RepID=F0JHE5_9BACT|nr:hypothetical protein [Pseudodesulfovibrio mercurii]EGB15260.1 hypothetical protein DND132_2055 [Pseudodesulfovibrio mercurii]
MLVHVDDAKFLFCPLLMTHDDRMKMCQVTQCMMWRWVDREKGTGYCGMAGKPAGADA